MSKGIYMMFRNKAEKHKYDQCVSVVAKQQMFDAIILALNREFGFGPERFKRFVDAYKDSWNTICDLFNEDFSDDKEMTYSKTKLDEALRQAVGDELFKPWEERYRL